MNGASAAGDVDHGTVGFEVGDRVVHPHHGAGVVVRCERRVLLGCERDYLEIELEHHALRILLPCESADGVGLRRVIDRRGLARIVAVLEDESDLVPSTWPARQKHYRGKLKEGDVFELAAVVRDLAMRAAESGLPTSERELYERSRRILASELRYALGVDPERAGAYIDAHIAGAQSRSG
jgi:CarD family transcriptional regulator